MTTLFGMTMTYVCVFNLLCLRTYYEICYVCELIITCECKKLLYLIKIVVRLGKFVVYYYDIFRFFKNYFLFIKILKYSIYIYFY